MGEKGERMEPWVQKIVVPVAAHILRRRKRKRTMGNNPFFNSLGGGQMPMNNFTHLLQQFKASFQGDAKAEVGNML